MKEIQMVYINARAIIEKIENDERKVLIQRRVSDGIPTYFEFPGGCISSMNESIIDALKREVLEETGLTVTKIHGIETYAHKDGIESVKPFSIYQLLGSWTNEKGECFKSIGAHFKCEADGEPLEKGDDSEMIQWATLDKLQKLLDEPNMFGYMDRGAAEQYLSECRL